MQHARECLTHTLQCGLETKCAHRRRAVGSGSRVCDVQEGLERMGQSCHSLREMGGPRVDTAASDGTTTPSAKKVCSTREHT